MANGPCPVFCDCCAGPVSASPLPIVNRPGLSKINWRIGSYATFREAMLEAIGLGPRNPDNPDDSRWISDTRAQLAGLTSRDDSDYGIMLVDLFAAVSDVLAFYSERYANELFLRTAAQRDSLQRLVRLIGYEPSPGVAATTALAFQLDAGARVKIAAGLKVMSVPGQDERPQIFETIGAIEADATLNDLPLFGAPTPLAAFAPGFSRLPLHSRPDPLLKGDNIVFVGAGTMDVNGIKALETTTDGEYLVLDRPIATAGAGVGFRLVRELRLFGHNLPASYAFYDANPIVPPAKRWVTRVGGVDFGLGLAAHLARYAFDRKVDDLKPGALLLADLGAGSPARFAFAFVEAVETGAATIGPLSDSVTWVRLAPVAPMIGADGFALLVGPGLPAIADLRKTRLFELVREAIVPRSYTYPATLSGGTIYARSDQLADPTLAEKKRMMIVSAGSERFQVWITGTVTLPAQSDGIGHVAIGISPALPPLSAARANLNVAPASNGETQPDEPLGHGNAAVTFQRFQLRRKSVTRLPSTTGIHPEAELAIMVNGERWQQVASLFGQRPTDRVYTMRYADDGTSTVGFGDGVTGARLPSGASNVVARYRIGMGLAGRVRPDQLSTLLVRPPGLRGVTNPLPADGGADPETLADARALAPATVRTFGRAIALLDFEDVACQTGLAARAKASWTWVGTERAVQLTVAGPGGAPLPPSALATLHQALDGARDPNHLLILSNLWRVPVVVEARVMRFATFDTDMVARAARSALLAMFDFAVMPFGRAVHLSQLVATLQETAGVSAIDVDRFHIKGIESWTPAQRARRAATADQVQPFVRLFEARPRPPAASLDPLALAGLAVEPDMLTLPAEQAFIEVPETDIVLHLVDAL